MKTGLLLAHLLLAVVFVVAGAAKLFDRQGSRKAIIDFGLPSALAAPLGLLLPVAGFRVGERDRRWWGQALAYAKQGKGKKAE